MKTTTDTAKAEADTNSNYGNGDKNGDVQTTTIQPPKEKDILLPSYTNHNGFLMPFGFPAQNFSNGLAYQPETNDLFVATYPKCGTTLMQHMVYTMLNHGVPVQPHERLDQIFPHLEEVGGDYIVRNKSATHGMIVKGGKCLIKTHLPYDMTPMSSASKYIFVARNPKDCVVSFFHHTRGFPKHYNFEHGDFDVFFDIFCEGKVDFGNYFKTLRSWLDHRDDDNVLFVTYENICRDKRQVLLQVAEFLGGGWREEVLKEDEMLLQKILHHTSLVEMKKHPLRWCSERQAEHTPFIRSGQVGGWNELLTNVQRQKLDDAMRMNFTELELTYLGPSYHGMGM